MKFNVRHRIRRELLGLSQKDVADRLKLTPATISKYESADMDELSEFVVNGIRTFYNNMAREVGLTDSEGRLLRIAENAVAMMREDSSGFRVKVATNIIIDCGFVIQDETKPKFTSDRKGVCK